ncbi:MAG: bifunctional DNA-formamidopyrimidine glycosylase/DNA-(apurinic or apyrimidinic site) lyase [Pseudomonadota bacterium]
MPELPEVETVRRGLQPAMLGARIDRVKTMRPDLRFPFPERFAERLEGAFVDTMDRRGKYLLCGLSSCETLIMHLGMSGRFTVSDGETRNGSEPGIFHHEHGTDPKHDHVIFDVSVPANEGRAKPRSSDGSYDFKRSQATARVVYNDPRRFGFMDLVATSEIDCCRHFKDMGPEPLSNAFSAEAFSEALRGKSTAIKAALLDQSVVAGIGNIYACEALFKSGISPRRSAHSLVGARAVRLQRAMVDVLKEAIDAGGSSLRDFAGAEGKLGYFQHQFSVYDREGEVCPCGRSKIKRIVQGGRSTFYCGGCQR